MFAACKEIAYKVRTASCDKMACFNEFGDEQLAIDVLANNVIFENLKACGCCATASSEETPVEDPMGGEVNTTLELLNNRVHETQGRKKSVDVSLFFTHSVQVFYLFSVLFLPFLKKNHTTPRPSEHPPVMGEKMSKLFLHEQTFCSLYF